MPNKKLNIEKIQNILKEKNLILLSEYKNSSSPLKVKCYCGNEFWVNQATYIIHGNTNSCGCLRRETTKINSGYKNLIGEKYGQLIVLNQSTKTNKRRDLFWECKCECGKIVSLRGNDLKYGNYSSCGCKKTLKGRFHHNFKGYEDISSQYFNSLKRGAKERNFEFDITIEQIWELFLQQNKLCALTGIPIKLNAVDKNDKDYDQTASLDRINSKLGYTIDNIQWIHKRLNFLKTNFPEEEFFNWIKLIYEHKKLDN